MSRHGVYLALALAALLVVGTAVVAEDATTTAMPSREDTTTKDEFYPISWTKVSYKPIIDNERLFRKYKQCLIEEKTTGCPNDVLQLKKIIPEVLDSMCAKCLPVHVERFKEVVEYICKKRRADYDEVRKSKDPDGSLQKQFEDKFGKVDCE